MRLLFYLMKRKFILAVICSISLCFFTLSTYAADVALQWDKPDDPRVVGYHVYCGKSDSDFKTNLCATTNSADDTQSTVTNLESGFEYSFAATSFDSNGNESEFSETLTVFIQAAGDIDGDGDGFTADEGDCNDANASINPAADEVCGDKIDQDCSGDDLPCDSIPGLISALFSDMPDADYPGTVQDTFINVNREVNTSSDQLNTYTWPANKPANTILIKFDLSQLPKGAHVENALLTLYQTEAGGDTYYDVSAHKIINHNPDIEHADGYTYDGSNSWTANNECYNNIPLAQADVAPAEDVNHLDLNSGYKGWNVTNMVQDWINDPDTNFGLILNSDPVAGSDSHRFFASSETGEGTRRPSLIVRYTIDSVDIDTDNDGYTVNQGDCDDTDAGIFPGAMEVCGDNIDQDCDGNDQICPEDIDNDGDGYTENQGDCNDNVAEIHIGAAEICGDGIDQDCSGSDLTCPEDLDDDNDGFTENQGDCDDNDSSIAPGIAEICGDGIDQDCDGSDLSCAPDTGATMETIVLGDIPGSDATGTVQDTFININRNVNEAAVQLNTYTWPTNQPANAIIIKFDLARLPKGAKIEKASLTLYQNEAGGDATYDVSVHKIINKNPDLNSTNGYTYNGIDNWTGNNDCYRSIPLAQADIASAEDVNHLDQTSGYKEWDVTHMVQDWVDDSVSNFGLLLNSDPVASADSHRFFASNEAAEAAQRPGLEIQYSVDSNEVKEYKAIFGDSSDADYPSAIQDTFININAGVNEAADQLNTYTWPTNKPANAIILKFDLSQLPEGAEIQSAALSLYQTVAGGDASYEVSAHKIIDHDPDLQYANGYTYDGVGNWTGNNDCYGKIPLAQADIDPAADVKELDLNLGRKIWNVTEIVRDWVEDSTSNFGLLLNSDPIASADSYRFFAASEADDASKRPTLEVIYTIK